MHFAKVPSMPSMPLERKKLFLVCHRLHASLSECYSYSLYGKVCFGYVLQNFGNIDGILNLVKSDELCELLGISR
jgi:hypothetical protein